MRFRRRFLRRLRPGVTLVETLLLVALLVVVMALLLPWMYSSPGPGRRDTCSNNLRNLVVAITHHADRHGSYPGYLDRLHRDDGTPYHDPSTGRPAPVSWVVKILPELDRAAQFALWRKVPAAEAGDSRPHAEPVEAAGPLIARPSIADTHVYIGLLVCPSDPQPSRTGTPLSYVLNTGLPDYSADPAPSTPPRDHQANGVFFDHYHSGSPRDARVPAPPIVSSPSRIVDLKETTILLTENLDAVNYTLDGASAATDGREFRTAEAQLGCTWVPGAELNQGLDRPHYDLPRSSRHINSDRGRGDGKSYPFSRPSSNHPGGVNVAFAGQNVVFLRDTISYFVYAKLMASDDAHASTAGTAWESERLPEAFQTHRLSNVEIHP